MNFIEALSNALAPRSPTALAMQERLAKSPSQAGQPETSKSVRPVQESETARLMMESRHSQSPHIPITGRTHLRSGSMTAAYLTEMRLQQELSDIQDMIAE